MKPCFKCGEVKPLNDFYRHQSMADGYLNKCKVCTKRDVQIREDRLRQDPEWVRRERARHREKFHRLSGNWNIDKEARRRAGRKWKRLNMHKRRAQNAVSNAIRDGRLFKPKRCQRCSSEPAPRDLHAHHADYNKPLDVEWLCTKCHGMEHRIDNAA